VRPGEAGGLLEVPVPPERISNVEDNELSQAGISDNHSWIRDESGALVNGADGKPISLSSQGVAF
jgi:hypothetical protein